MEIKLLSKVRSRNGFTLIETLVVISIFSVLAVITAQMLLRIIRSTSTSSSSTKVRENMEYALAITERSVRNAKNLTCAAAPAQSITLTTQENISETFSCSTSGGIQSLYRNTDRLTSRDINLTTCTLTCDPATNPNTVLIVLEGEDDTGSYSNTPLKLQTQVSLRSY